MFVSLYHSYSGNVVIVSVVVVGFTCGKYI